MIATAIETTGVSRSPSNASGSSHPMTGPAKIPVRRRNRIDGNFSRHAIHWQAKPATKIALRTTRSTLCIEHPDAKEDGHPARDGRLAVTGRAPKGDQIITSRPLGVSHALR